jgi:hypothetical protein
MPIGCLLTLSDGRERQYWADAGTQRQLRRFDALGLAAGVIVNMLHMTRREIGRIAVQWENRRAVVALAGLLALSLQLAQLAWLILRPQSYTRHRTIATIIQRLRWTAFATILQRGASEEVISVNPFRRPQPGTLGTFLSVFCLVPV